MYIQNPSVVEFPSALPGEVRSACLTCERSWLWTKIAVVSGLVLILSGYLHAGKHDSRGFTVDLPRPLSAVWDVVQRESRDGVIRGTSQYAHETIISGAVSAPSSKSFPLWTGPGDAFYKVRTEILAPAHFPGSNDSGTVTVRYMVQALDPSTTRLRIEAIFVEASGHASRASDGSVEAAEFQAIDAQLSVLDGLGKRTREKILQEQMEFKKRNLQQNLEDEVLQLGATTASVQKLEQRLALLHRQTSARVKTDKAQLKAAPFIHAETVALLPKDQLVTVLTRTTHWYRVRGPNGESAWICSLLLEPVQ
jgi:hypothetical protein